ncbi:peptide chain release factor N(5)-glutamine methyltransferase [Hydrogenivirga sp.]
MKLKQLLLGLPEKLRRDGEVILAHLLGTSPSRLHLLLESEASPDLQREFKRLIEKREEGVSVAHLIGEWDFFGRTFSVREGVLVPRPETELLVERVLRLIPEDREKEGFEIGGGTGCISITLLLERPLLRMSVSDINRVALDLIRENARRHNVEDRLEVLEGDLFSPVKNRRFDFVVSNPPYIPERVWGELPPEVRREGYTSLIGGREGYEFYERLAKEVRRHLYERGFVALEIGHDQGKVVKELLEGAGLKEVMIYKDYSGQDRVVIAWS